MNETLEELIRQLNEEHFFHLKGFFGDRWKFVNKKILYIYHALKK